MRVSLMSSTVLEKMRNTNLQSYSLDIVTESLLTVALIDRLIDWCLAPTLEVFQLYRGVKMALIFIVICRYKQLQMKVQWYKGTNP